jgi:hypothetical protein
VGLKLLGLELAAEQVAGSELPDPEIVEGARPLERRQGSELLTPYLQFRAPRRQT